LDESCTSNPKSEIADWTVVQPASVQFEVSDFGFEVQASSNFEFSRFIQVSFYNLPDMLSSV